MNHGQKQHSARRYMAKQTLFFFSHVLLFRGKKTRISFFANYLMFKIYPLTDFQQSYKVTCIMDSLNDNKADS